MKAVGHIRASRAFSLLELLVATAVMALLLGLASQVVSSGLNQWSFANEKMSANLQARLAFDWMGRDIQSLCLDNDGSEWIRIAPVQVAGAGGQTMKASKFMGYAQPAERLKDPAIAASPPKISGPIAISYTLGYLDPMVHNGNRKRFAILRTSVNPRDTYENMGVGNLETDFWAEGVLGFTTIRPEDILADNAVGLRVVAEFVPSDSSTPVRSDPSEVFTCGPDGQIKVGSTVYPDATLTALDISLWILDAKSAARINAGGTANLANGASAFTKRIPVLAR
jgi:prepilin-type N-terminal cleavage/methylation domain-containing protein